MGGVNVEENWTARQIFVGLTVPSPGLYWRLLKWAAPSYEKES
jgi:hypothetical protein